MYCRVENKKQIRKILIRPDSKIWPKIWNKPLNVSSYTIELHRCLQGPCPAADPNLQLLHSSERNLYYPQNCSISSINYVPCRLLLFNVKVSHHGWNRLKVHKVMLFLRKEPDSGPIWVIFSSTSKPYFDIWLSLNQGSTFTNVLALPNSHRPVFALTWAKTTLLLLCVYSNFFLLGTS